MIIIIMSSYLLVVGVNELITILVSQSLFLCLVEGFVRPLFMLFGLYLPLFLFQLRLACRALFGMRLTAFLPHDRTTGASPLNDY